MERTAELNSKAIDLLMEGDSEGAIRSLVSALATVTAEVTQADKTQRSVRKNESKSSSFVVKAVNHFIGTGMRTTGIEYFERLFFIDSIPTGGESISDEQAAYCSSICFYNMAIASYNGFKKQPLDHDRLTVTYDLFLRAFDLLAVCKLDPDDSKVIMLLAICNNLAAVQAELGNLGILKHWADKFYAILGFADAMSHWNDATYHYFRLKQLLSSFAISAAGAA